MMRILPALILLAAAQGTDPGPVGTMLVVHPGIMEHENPDNFPCHSVTYVEAIDRYVSLYCVKLSDTTRALCGSLIDPATGTVGAPVQILVDDIADYSLAIGSARASWNPSTQRLLVSFQGNYNKVRGILLDAALGPVGAGTFIISPQGGYNTLPSLACDGTNWLVTWSSESGGMHIAARLVMAGSTNASPLFAGPDFSLSTAGTLYINTPPSVAFGAGSDYLVTWAQESDARGRTVSPTGTLGALQTYSQAEAGMGIYAWPVVAANTVNREFLVAWNQAESFRVAGVSARRVDASGAPIGAVIDVEQDAAHRVFQDSPCLSATWQPLVNQYLVTWLEDPDTDYIYEIRAARIGGSDGTVVDHDLLIPSPGISGQSAPSAPACAARSASDGQVIIQWRRETEPRWDPMPLEAQRYTLGAVFNAPTASALQQVRLDGSTAIPNGGSTNQTSFIAKATVVSPGGLTVRLEVEVQEAGVAFTGTPTPGAVSTYVPSGTTIALTLPLTRGKNYHWQARGTDSRPSEGTWTSFHTDPDNVNEIDLSVEAANRVPVPSALGQFKGAGNASIAIGQPLSVGTVEFRATVGDPDGNDARLEVEIRRIGESFTGTPTAIGPFVPVNGIASVGVEGMEEGRYHWQARLRDSALEAGAWNAFGGNGDAAADFVIMARGSTAGTSCAGSTAGASRVGFLSLAAALALMAGCCVRR